MRLKYRIENKKNGSGHRRSPKITKIASLNIEKKNESWKKYLRRMGANLGFRHAKAKEFASREHESKRDSEERKFFVFVSWVVREREREKKKNRERKVLVLVVHV
jgi:hypothetical protein